jgi:Undecaprenyl-phosphate glucose phosphotransferase
MSAEVEHFEQRASPRRTASLSQDVMSGIVMICDGVAVVSTAFLGQLILVIAGYQPLGVSIGLVGLAATLSLLSFSAAGLYRFPSIMRPGDQVKKIFATCLGVAVGLVAVGFSFDINARFSRLWGLAWLVSAIFGVIGFRILVAGLLRSLAEAGRIGRRIVIYGAGPQGERLIQRINMLGEPWNRIVGVFDDRAARYGPTAAGCPVLGTLDDLLLWGRGDRPDEVLVALPWSAEERILQILHQLAALPSNVRLASEFHRLDMILGRTNSQFGLPMLSAYEKPLEGWARIWKRLFDLLLAMIAIVVAAPLLAVIALLIRLESPGPILFQQPRYGFNNTMVQVYKFRTMRADASDALGVRLTQRGDARVTRVGAVLRRFSLDELPQLFNVLRGEMSLVGPRPHAIRTTAGGRQCDIVVDQYAVRHKVKPGITGWAQVNGWRGTMETEEALVKRLEHDLFYINNWSPLFDIKILLMTIWSVSSGRNSY